MIFRACDHEDGFQAKLSPAVIEKIFQAWSQQVHDYVITEQIKRVVQNAACHQTNTLKEEEEKSMNDKKYAHASQRKKETHPRIATPANCQPGTNRARCNFLPRHTNECLGSRHHLAKLDRVLIQNAVADALF